MSSSKADPSVIARLRAAYLAGRTISEIIVDEATFRAASPIQVMWVLMDTFHVGLADVSCIDGWWPPGGLGEVTDDNLDRFVREAIETHRSEWCA